MHYYKRNLGDYAKKAGRLTMLQHGSYTLLIDACYDREKFPTMDEAIEWAWASTPDEVHAVQFVLSKFFTLENGVYVQNRIRQELDEFHAKSLVNQRIAIERETKRAEFRTKRAQVDHEPPPNQEPRTTNHKKPKTIVQDKPLDEFETFWKAYPRRQARKDAIDAWNSPKVKIDLPAILKAIEAKKAAGEWDDVQYIPMPAVWLRGSRWTDEILPPSTKTKLSTVVPTQARTCTHCKEPAHMEISGRWYCRNHDQYSTSEAA